MKFCDEAWFTSEVSYVTRDGEEGVGTNRLLALAVHLFERVLPCPLCLESLVVLVQLERCPRVLDRVVRVGLDRRVQDGVGEEPQRQLALPRGEVVNVDRVDDLMRRDVDVCTRVTVSSVGRSGRQPRREHEAH